MIRRILDHGLADGPDALNADRGAVDLSFGCLADVGFDLPQRGSHTRTEYLRRTWDHQCSSSTRTC
jgi:hypothetical protein